MDRKNKYLAAPSLFIVFTVVMSMAAVRAFAEDVPLDIVYADGTVIRDTIQLKDQRSSPRVMRGEYILVDTTDREACRQIQRSLKGDRSIRAGRDLDRLCELDPEKPIVSLAIFREVDGTEFRRDLDLHFLKNNEKTLVNDTRNLALSMTGMMGLLWVLPESISKWDKEKIRNSGFLAKYRENVTHAPVMDKDAWAVNYIGHPISGAAYYTMARHAGLSRMQAFGYSVLMSTFFWEYGFEAVAEKPSIQDLIITPVIGSLMGEMFYQMEQSIAGNGGKFMGSEKAGKIAMVMLNPMGSLSNGINKVLGSQVIQDAKADVVFRQRKSVDGMPSSGGAYIGIEVKFSFW